jgi:hypothetical protein
MNIRNLDNIGFVSTLPYLVANQPKSEAQRTLDEVKAIDPNHEVVSELEKIIAKK